MADPVVHNNAPTPPASDFVQKHKNIIALTVACGILLLSWLGMNKTDVDTRKVQQAIAPTADENSYQKAKKILDEDSKRLAASQKAAEAARQRYEQTEAEYQPGRETYRAPQDTYRPQVDLIAEDRRQAEWKSRFAPNIVPQASMGLTYGREPVSVAQTLPIGSEKDTVQTSEAAIQATDPAKAIASKPAPEGGHKIFEGTVIETVTTNRIIGDFAGPINTMVTIAVRSHDLQEILIPTGTRVLGTAQKVQEQHQERVAVVFHRMIMPDGYSVDIKQMQGLDQQGATALKDQVNRHLMSTFGTSLLLGAIAGFSMYGTSGMLTADGADQYRQGVSNQLGRDSTRILDRQMSRLPDITIREGTRCRVYVNADFSLPPYRLHKKVEGL